MDLMKDEHIVYETHVSYIVPIAYVLLWMAFYQAPVVAVLIIIFGISVFMRKFILTNKRFVKKTWFWTNEMRLEKIETVKLKGLLWSWVEVCGTGSGKIVAKSINKPQKLVNEIHQELDNIKK